jgi:AcrR family transcriptional regulator
VTRNTCKHLLLDAAEVIVTEQGAAHLTLDAVAERAGVSKGGLLYHFPSKEALLEGLMARNIEVFDARRDAALNAFSEDPARELKADLLSFLEKADRNPSACRGMLAAVANDPRLLEVMRERHRNRFQYHASQAGSFERKAVTLLAGMGLAFLEMFQTTPFDAQQRKGLIEELMRLADESVQ